MTESILQIKDLKKSFGDNEILKGISLDVKQGEVVVILGSSGCGKSTLLRCINGLETIQGGDILLDGKSITGSKKDFHLIRQKIGMVFQSYDLFPHLDILQNLILGPVKAQGRNKEEVIAEAEKLLDRVGLLDKKHSFARQLSGGQKQRVAIVRSLLMHPEVILFDEVTASLDPEMVREVLELINDLAQEGRTMLIVTHELQFARAIADRIIFMDKGVIAEEGTAEEFFNHPKTQRAQEFLNVFDFSQFGLGDHQRVLRGCQRGVAAVQGSLRFGEGGFGGCEGVLCRGQLGFAVSKRTLRFGEGGFGGREGVLCGGQFSFAVSKRALRFGEGGFGGREGGLGIRQGGGGRVQRGLRVREGRFGGCEGVLRGGQAVFGVRQGGLGGGQRALRVRQLIPGVRQRIVADDETGAKCNGRDCQHDGGNHPDDGLFPGGNGTHSNPPNKRRKWAETFRFFQFTTIGGSCQSRISRKHKKRPSADKSRGGRGKKDYSCLSASRLTMVIVISPSARQLWSALALTSSMPSAVMWNRFMLMPWIRQK